MQVWKAIIRPDPQAPDLAQGYALAESREEVYERVGHRNRPVKALWRGSEDRCYAALAA